MTIIIDTSPERLTKITYIDGIGNQIYPPAQIENNNIIDYIKGSADEHDINEIIVSGPKCYTEKIYNNLKNNFKTVKFALI